MALVFQSRFVHGERVVQPGPNYAEVTGGLRMLDQVW